MRDSPTFQVAIRCYGGWQAAVAVLGVAALTTLLAWLWELGSARSAVDWLLASTGAVVIAAAFGCIAQRPLSLRWDTRVWWLGSADGAGDEAASGQVDVPVDFSVWMLLRFTRAPCRRWDRVTWIPVQRRGLEAHWHALRCAVYTARAAPDSRVIASDSVP